MKKIIIDLDGTLTNLDTSDYTLVSPRIDVVSKLIEYQKVGFYIVISTARNMRTFDGNVGRINVHTLPTIIQWLDKHNVPYDEIIVGKPWCGDDGFYVDDRAVRPAEFANNSFEEIKKILQEDKECF